MYVILRFTSHYVTKKTWQNKLYTYILYIYKDDKNDSDGRESGGSGDNDDG